MSTNSSTRREVVIPRFTSRIGNFRTSGYWIAPLSRHRIARLVQRAFRSLGLTQVVARWEPITEITVNFRKMSWFDAVLNQMQHMREHNLRPTLLVLSPTQLSKDIRADEYWRIAPSTQTYEHFLGLTLVVSPYFTQDIPLVLPEVQEAWQTHPSFLHFLSG